MLNLNTVNNVFLKKNKQSKAKHLKLKNDNTILVAQIVVDQENTLHILINSLITAWHIEFSCHCEVSQTICFRMLKYTSFF